MSTCFIHSCWTHFVANARNNSVTKIWGAIGPNDLINPNKQTLLGARSWKLDHWRVSSSQRFDCQSVMLIWLSRVKQRQLRRLRVSSTYYRLRMNKIAFSCSTLLYYLIANNSQRFYTHTHARQPPCIFNIYKFYQFLSVCVFESRRTS